MNSISKELMGASAMPFILSIVNEKDAYGYEIMAKLKEFSNGRIHWKEGSLYPVLKKMQDLKYIKSYWNTEDFDRPRKYYKILAGGKKELASLKDDWIMVNDILKTLWATST